MAFITCIGINRPICSLYFRYYSGERRAPILTIFIGGNHEASNYLQELPYGGWVAPNIYYMGRASVIKFGDLRIGGNFCPTVSFLICYKRLTLAGANKMVFSLQKNKFIRSYKLHSKQVDYILC